MYGTLIAGGIAAMLMFQILVNVGMTLGVMPVTGVTLPLMSYGGSSVIATFLAIGLLQSIHAQARLNSSALAAGRQSHCCAEPPRAHPHTHTHARRPAHRGGSVACVRARLAQKGNT